MTFYVGQKVVCVEGSTLNYILEKGKSYTISDYGDFWGELLYDVAEIKTDIPHGWAARMFRPLIEKSTDTGMAILREILDRESVGDKVNEKA